MHLIWEEFLKIIREEAGSQVVETWFKAVTFEEWNPATNQVILRTPNQFVRKWVQEHYTNLLKIHLARLLHKDDIKLLFLCKEQEVKNQKIIPASVIQNQQKIVTQTNDFITRSKIKQHHYPVTRKSTNVVKTRQNKDTKNIDNINENYTFTSFVVGPSNSLAHAAGAALCKEPGRIYNPLFIYGGTGLGKTHLLHAIGNETKQRFPRLLIRYETSDRFITGFINAIRFDKSQQFRDKYTKLDMLLLDDVQFLSNKEQTQEMFFHIFNILHEQKKQIILSSDTFPKEIKGLQGRLKSRMEWGLVADIQMPDLETKIAILKKKSALHAIHLPDDVADFIASRVLSNIRQLEGALIRVSAFSSLTNQPISLDMAKKVLLNLNESHENKKEGVMLDNILKTIARYYAISINDIKSKKRHKDIAIIRQVTFYMMKKMTRSSLQSIGTFIGGRDHSTVIHAVTKIEKIIQHDIDFTKKLKIIEQKILMDQ